SLPTTPRAPYTTLFRSSRGRYVNSVQRNPQVRGTETLVLGFHRTGEQDVAIRENADLLLEDNYEEEYGFDPRDPSTYIIFQLMRSEEHTSELQSRENLV